MKSKPNSYSRSSKFWNEWLPLLVFILSLLVLVFNDRLKVQRQGSLKKIGTIVGTGAEVKRKTSIDGDFLNLRGEHDVFFKDTIFVGPNSSAKLELGEFGTFDLTPNAVAVVVLDFEKELLPKSDTSKKKAKLQVKLLHGELNYTPPPKKLEKDLIQPAQVFVDVGEGEVLELDSTSITKIEKKAETPATVEIVSVLPKDTQAQPVQDPAQSDEAKIASENYEPTVERTQEVESKALKVAKRQPASTVETEKKVEPQSASELQVKAKESWEFHIPVPPVKFDTDFSFRNLRATDKIAQGKLASLYTDYSVGAGFTWLPRISQRSRAQVGFGFRHDNYTQPKKVARLSDASLQTYEIRAGAETVFSPSLGVSYGVAIGQYLSVSDLDFDTVSMDKVLVPSVYLSPKISFETYKNVELEVELPLKLLTPGSSSSYSSRWGYEVGTKVNLAQLLGSHLWRGGVFANHSYFTTSFSSVRELSAGIQFSVQLAAGKESEGSVQP